MLKLVIDNTPKITDAPICQTSCSLYDPFTNECGIWQNAKTDEPKTFAVCRDRIPLVEDTGNYWETEESMFDAFDEFVFQGEDNTVSKHHLYPFQPDVNVEREEAVWYVSPDESFGCWIVNHSRRKVMDSEHLTPPKNDTRYRSLIPLHNHRASAVLASNMCWYINEHGIGQYKLLIKDKLLDL